MADIQVTSKLYILITDTSTEPYPIGTIYNPEEELPPGVLRVENIVAGSAHLDELLCDGELQFGQMCASKFEVTVYDALNVGGKYITVYQQDDDAQTTTLLFTGIIDSAKLDRFNTGTAIVAYDYTYAASRINIADWWTDYWTDLPNSSLKDLRESLLDYLQIYYEDVDLMNDDFTVTKTVDISSISFIEMLRAICELNCCFPHFDRSGVLRFYVLPVDSTPVSLEGLYEGDKSTFQDYISKPITGIQFYGDSSSLNYVEGTSDNPYTIQNNIFIYNKSGLELHTLGDNMLDYLDGLTYCPSTVSLIVSSLELQLGAKVSTSKGVFYVLHNTLENSMLIDQTIEQSGSESKDEVSVATNISNLFIQESIKDIGKIQSSEISFSRNSVPITIADGGYGVIATITYDANEGEVVLFHEEISLTAQLSEVVTENSYTFGDASILVDYWVNGRKLSNRESIGNLIDGKNIVNLMQFWKSGVQSNSRLQAFLRPVGCNISIDREQASAYIIIREAVLIDFQIVVTSEPSKTEYEWGEPLDYTGLVVKKIYFDTSIPSEDITSKVTITPPEGTRYYETEGTVVECVVDYFEINEVGEVKYYTTNFYCDYAGRPLDLEYLIYTLNSSKGIMTLKGLNVEKIAEDNPSDIIIPAEFTLNGVHYTTKISDIY